MHSGQEVQVGRDEAVSERYGSGSRWKWDEMEVLRNESGTNWRRHDTEMERNENGTKKGRKDDAECPTKRKDKETEFMGTRHKQYEMDMGGNDG